MINFQDLQSKQDQICVVGLGYVGLPLAVLLSKKFSVIGFDINAKRISQLKQGIERTNEVASHDLSIAKIEYTSDSASIKRAGFIIIAVPTPVDEYNIPDMSIVQSATRLVGQNLKQGAIVVYESTVYPGATEEICQPILAKESGLSAGVDFKIGYSPERVNPGDKEHTIDKVVKVVSGMDDESLELIANVYGSITKVHRAPDIKTAEAAKVIENTQRDLNIALMNELAVLFNKMDISVYDVLAAAGTKWNFLPFKPGLVGGHCIGVDPYYLTYKAQAVGHNPKLILAGRGINDNMHKFIAHQIIKQMVRLNKDMQESNIVVLGVTFKENINDVRNSKVAGLIKELKSFGLNVFVYDPLADHEEIKKEYGFELSDKAELPKADTLVVAAAHDEFKNLSVSDLRAMMNQEKLLLMDVKNLYDQKEIEQAGINYLSL